jgi:hypothetical protein
MGRVVVRVKLVMKFTVEVDEFKGTREALKMLSRDRFGALPRMHKSGARASKSSETCARPGVYTS